MADHTTKQVTGSSGNGRRFWKQWDVHIISIPSIFLFLACSEAIFATFFLTLPTELDCFRVHKSAFAAVANDRTMGSAASNSL